MYRSTNLQKWTLFWVQEIKRCSQLQTGRVRDECWYERANLTLAPAPRYQMRDKKHSRWRFSFRWQKNLGSWTNFMLIDKYFFTKEPEGHYPYSMMSRWEPEGCYHCTKSMVMAPFWFSTEHCWTALCPSGSQPLIFFLHLKANQNHVSITMFGKSSSGGIFQSRFQLTLAVNLLCEQLELSNMIEYRQSSAWPIF